jgi:hypothetical protein
MTARFIVILRSRGISEFLSEFFLAPGRFTALVVNAQPGEGFVLFEAKPPDERARDRERPVTATLASDRRWACGQKRANARVERRLASFRPGMQFHGLTRSLGVCTARGDDRGMFTHAYIIICVCVNILGNIPLFGGKMRMFTANVTGVKIH